MKKKKARRSKKLIVGICWYLPEEWARVKATAIDPERFENSFSAWEAMMAQQLPFVPLADVNAVRVYIDADEFFAWCRLRGRVNDASARADFVLEKVRTATTELPSI